MDDVAISAVRLEKVYGEGDIQVRAVRDIDLEVRRGEVILIMGPSGSGKTTLLSMLGAMLRPNSGRIVVDGEDLARLSERHLPAFRAHRFGFVFQDFNLLAALTAQENVEFALNLAGVTGRQARDRAEGLLREFGLGERLRFRPEKLSGGEKAARGDRPGPGERAGGGPGRRADREPRLEDRTRHRSAAPARGQRA